MLRTINRRKFLTVVSVIITCE